MPIDASIPQCHHIKVNGLRCGSPSLRGRKFCYFHYEVTRSLIRTDIPVIEDAASVQYSLNRLAEYILEKRIDYKQASLLIWIMQIAASNARNSRLEPINHDDIVRTHPNDHYFPNHLSPEEMTAQISAALSDPNWSAHRDSDAPDSAAEDSSSSAPHVSGHGFSHADPGRKEKRLLSEGHGFSRAVSKPGTGASAPEANPAAFDDDDVIAVSSEDLALLGDAAPAADSELPSEGHGFNRAASNGKNGALAPEGNRKRPTRQEI